jgi:hypothetical protein
MNQIKIYLSSITKADKAPRAEIVSKSLNINDTIDVDKPFCYEFIASAGIHDLSLNFNNKEVNDTIIVNGKIVEDLAIIVDDIVINDISFKSEIDKFSLYTDWDGNLINTYGWLSFPTAFKMKFQVPGMLFKRNIALLDVNNHTFEEFFNVI